MLLTIQKYWNIIKINSKEVGNGVEIMEPNLEIKSYLEERGISKTFISNKTGIPLPKLNLALNGNRKLTFDEYAVICGVLGENTDKFLKPRLPREA